MILPLILSSTSPARKELLQRLQLSFECASPNIDETPLTNENPEELVKRLAEEKARALATKYPNALIIGADSVGVLNNEFLCKPLTHENGVKTLQIMSGQLVKFLTGLCVYNTYTQERLVAVEEYDVLFRKLSPQMIEHYLQKEDALQCAGCFHAERLGIALVEKFMGDDFTTLIGLPLIRLTTMLNYFKLNVI